MNRLDSDFVLMKRRIFSPPLAVSYYFSDDEPQVSEFVV